MREMHDKLKGRPLAGAAQNKSISDPEVANLQVNLNGAALGDCPARNPPEAPKKSRERYGSLWPIELILHAIRSQFSESDVGRHLAEQGLRLLRDSVA
jgi:hypothetical protein